MSGVAEQEVAALMRDVTNGERTASQTLAYNPASKRLEAKTSEEVERDPNLIRITPEDMKVSFGLNAPQCRPR